MDLNSDIHHIILLALFEVVKGQLIWSICGLDSTPDGIILDIFAPSFNLSKVRSPIRTMDHANATRADLFDLVVQLVGRPEVKVPVEDGRDELNDSLGRIRRYSVDHHEDVIDQRELLFDGRVAHQDSGHVEVPK